MGRRRPPSPWTRRPSRASELARSCGRWRSRWWPPPSMAQVPACRLADGREAVVKIQRPGIARRMNRDLCIMYRFARALDRTKRGHIANVVAVVEDLHQVTNEELNFALEAHRQD